MNFKKSRRAALRLLAAITARIAAIPFIAVTALVAGLLVLAACLVIGYLMAEPIIYA